MGMLFRCIMKFLEHTLKEKYGNYLREFTGQSLGESVEVCIFSTKN